MPIYDYKCDNGHTFEAMQSMSEDPIDECDVCGAPARRVLHAPAVHFKGSGFYTTDYARKGKAKAANGSESSGSESSKSDSGDSKASAEAKSGSGDSGSSSGSGEKTAAKKD